MTRFFTLLDEEERKLGGAFIRVGRRVDLEKHGVCTVARVSIQ